MVIEYTRPDWVPSGAHSVPSWRQTDGVRGAAFEYPAAYSVSCSLMSAYTNSKLAGRRNGVQSVPVHSAIPFTGSHPDGAPAYWNVPAAIMWSRNAAKA